VVGGKVWEERRSHAGSGIGVSLVMTTILGREREEGRGQRKRIGKQGKGKKYGRPIRGGDVCCDRDSVCWAMLLAFTFGGGVC
jgi:hypothetical protein